MSFIEAISEKVTRGECILFLGAGVHYPPPEGSGYEYQPEQRPALSGTLAEGLAAECDFVSRFPRDSPTNLQRVSLCYEIAQRSRQQLVNRIRDAVQTGKQPSPVVRALAELPLPADETRVHWPLCCAGCGADLCEVPGQGEMRAGSPATAGAPTADTSPSDGSCAGRTWRGTLPPCRRAGTRRRRTGAERVWRYASGSSITGTASRRASSRTSSSSSGSSLPSGGWRG